MQKHEGAGCLTLINPLAAQGRLIKYLVGQIRVDYMGIGAPPLYDVKDIQFIAELVGQSVTVPEHNVAGVVWTDKKF